MTATASRTATTRPTRSPPREPAAPERRPRRLRPRDLRLQPRGLVRRRGAVARGPLPRRGPGQPERSELRRGRRRRADRGVRERSDGTSRPHHGSPAHIARSVPRPSGVGDGGRPPRGARRRPDLRRRPLGPAALRPSRLGRARDRPPHPRRRHRRGSRARVRRDAGRLGRKRRTPCERARLDTALWQLGRPSRVRAQAGDRVHRLRRLPEPRLATDVLRRMPCAHPRLLGLGVLRLKRARTALCMGDGVPSRPTTRRATDTRSRIRERASAVARGESGRSGHAPVARKRAPRLRHGSFSRRARPRHTRG